MSLTPIASLADVKQYGGITSNNTDGVLTEIMASALGAIGSYCNRNFQSQSYNIQRNGNGGRRMQLANYPITSFISLTIDDIPIIPSISTSAQGFIAPVGGRSVALRGYTFTCGLYNVAAAFVAGYGDGSGVGGADIAPWPEDLKLAYMIYVLARFNERTRYGVGSKVLAGESITYNDGASGNRAGQNGIPAAAQAILYNYVNTIPETDL